MNIAHEKRLRCRTKRPSLLINFPVGVSQRFRITSNLLLLLLFPFTMPKTTSVTKKRCAMGKCKSSKKIPILPCLANLHKAGIEEIPRHQVVSLTGYSKDSLRVMLCKLRTQGKVEWDSPKTVRLTKIGWETVGEVNDSSRVVMSNEDTQTRLKETYKLSGTKADIFDLLLDGAAHSVANLMAAVKCTNPDSFRVYCSSLTSKKVAERVKGPMSGEKMLQLTDLCFPFGRPNKIPK